METKKIIKDEIIIIGAGPAGITSAIYACRAGKSVTIIEKTAVGGQIANTHLLENYPGFPEGISGFDFAEALKKQALKFGAKLVNAKITSVELSGKDKIIHTSEADYISKAVIIATGAIPKKLGIEGEKAYVGMGISFCATCDGMFFKNAEVAVIGGGDTALGDAIYLSNICKKVYVIHRRNEFRASKILVEQAKNKENIEFLMNKTPEKFFGGFNFEGIVLKDKSTGEETELKVMGCFEAVGYTPDTELFCELAKDQNGYIIADESTHTNLAAVFVAGDVRAKKLRQVVTATSDGAVAANEAVEFLG